MKESYNSFGRTLYIDMECRRPSSLIMVLSLIVRSLGITAFSLKVRNFILPQDIPNVMAKHRSQIKHYLMGRKSDLMM